MACLVKLIHATINSFIEIEHYFSSIVWLLNILLLLSFLLELRLRGVGCMKNIPHAYLMVLLSMLSSVISSTCFILSQSHFFFDAQYLTSKICLFGPIIAISFRTIAKHFTWAFYIIRGQMVMESLDKKSTRIAKKAPYMLLAQCIIITTLIIIFTRPHYDSQSDSCTVYFPLALLICSALFGELFYGLGFMYIFYKAMSVSMDHVYNSISKRHASSIKHQIRHHITIYSVQLISSLLFICFVSLCLCFDTLVFFEAELFISNLCLMALFRNKKKFFRKLCCTKKNVEKQNVVSKVRPHATSDNGTLGAPFAAVRSHSDLRGVSNVDLRTTNGNIKKFVHSAVDSDNFLSDNWRTNATVHNLKAALKLAEAAPKLNSKALEMLGVSAPKKKHMRNTQSIDHVIDFAFGDARDKKYAIGSIQSHSNPLSKAYEDRKEEEEEDDEAPIPQTMKLHRSVSEKTPEPETTQMHLSRPSLQILTKSEPLFVAPMMNKINKGQNSPSVHLLEESTDLVSESKQNTSIMSKFKKGMKRMSVQINHAPITLTFGNKMRKNEDEDENKDMSHSPSIKEDATVYIEPPDSVYIDSMDGKNINAKATNDTIFEHVSQEMDQNNVT